MQITATKSGFIYAGFFGIRQEQQNEMKPGNRQKFMMVSDKQATITVTWRFIVATVTVK
jgi:hypothetical protein